MAQQPAQPIQKPAPTAQPQPGVVQQPAPATPAAQPVQPGAVPPVEKKKSKWWLWLLIVIVFLGVIGGALWLWVF